MKKVLIFSLARSYEILLILEQSVPRNYLRILFVICRIREMHFSELVKGICHLSAARRQIGRKTLYFGQWKTEFGQGKVSEFCFCMSVATLTIVSVTKSCPFSNFKTV